MQLFTAQFTVYPRPDGAPESWFAGFTATTYDDMVRLLRSEAMVKTMYDIRQLKDSPVIDVQIVELQVKGATEFSFLL